MNTFLRAALIHVLNKKKEAVKATTNENHVPLEKVKIMLEKITALEIIHSIFCQMGFFFKEKYRLRRNGINKNPP
jgi:hypothetical protein